MAHELAGGFEVAEGAGDVERGEASFGGGLEDCAFGEEVADARDAADFGGGVQGAEAVVVGGFQVGTCFEEKVDDLQVAAVNER